MLSFISPSSTHQRITISLFLAQSLFSAAIIASFTLTSIIAAQLSGSDSAAGLPSTVTLIGRAAAAYPIGWLLDRIGRRNGLSLGYLIGVAGSALAAWSVVTGSFLGFVAGAALLGGSRAASEQGRYIAAEVFPAERQAKIIGLVVFAGTIGAITGPLIVDGSGIIANDLGMDSSAGPFMIAALLLAAAAAIVFAFLRPDPLVISRQLEKVTLANTKDSEAPKAPERPLRQIFRSANALIAVASMMIGQLVMALLMIITPLHMSHHDHSTRSISLVIMAHTLGMFGLSSVTGWLIGRFGRKPIIVTGAVVLVSACLLAPVSVDLPLLALSLFLLGLGWNFCFVAGSSLLSVELSSTERGRAQGAGEVAVALGAGMGGLGSGLLFARGDMIAVSAVGLILSLALLGLVIWTSLPGRQIELDGAGAGLH